MITKLFIVPHVVDIRMLSAPAPQRTYEKTMATAAREKAMARPQTTEEKGPGTYRAGKNLRSFLYLQGIWNNQALHILYKDLSIFGHFVVLWCAFYMFKNIYDCLPGNKCPRDRNDPAKPPDIWIKRSLQNGTLSHQR